MPTSFVVLREGLSVAASGRGLASGSWPFGKKNFVGCVFGS
jgi:hypothetical protein